MNKISPEQLSEMRRKAIDLQKQAQIERSHYYVASVLAQYLFTLDNLEEAYALIKKKDQALMKISQAGIGEGVVTYRDIARTALGEKGEG